MSSPKGKRDIVRLRTFADDVESVSQEKGVSVETVAKVLPSEGPVQKKGVFHNVQKKSLDFKETQVNTSLDSDGVKFDEAVADQVANQAYEEHKAVKESKDVATDVVDIHQTDAVVSTTHQVTTPTEQLSKITTPAEPTPKAPPPKPDMQSFNIKPAIHTTAQSITSDVPVERDDLHEGEIVTDKKRERFKLIPAIEEAVGEWFDETKEHIEESQKEKYTVGKVEDRIETIKAAAQQKTLAPDEDFMEVAKRLKEVRKDTAATPASPVVIKPKPAVEARWTHTIEEGTPTTPTQTTAHTTLSNTAPATPTPVTPQPTAQPTPVKPAEITPPPEQNIAPSTDASQTFTPNNKLTQASSDAAAVTSSVAVASAPAQKFSLPTVKLPSLTIGKEFLPSPVMALIVVGVAIFAGVGTSLYFFWQPAPEEVVYAPAAQPLFTAELQTSVPLTTHAETMETLLSAVNSRSDTLFMYFTNPETEAAVPASQTMSFLAPLVPGSFARSVTNVSIGAQGSRPFIVLKVNNFDNAFTGMLAWEQSMSADLAPLFGKTVTESFDPQARTDSRTRAAYFRDIIASNLSGRLLADEHGDDRIIYVFIDKQTIVIASDRLQLSNIIPLLR